MVETPLVMQPVVRRQQQPEVVQLLPLMQELFYTLLELTVHRGQPQLVLAVIQDLQETLSELVVAVVVVVDSILEIPKLLEVEGEIFGFGMVLFSQCQQLHLEVSLLVIEMAVTDLI
jgi:hypothetical protein